jgi:plasmid stabilization system protein ParE
MEREIIWTEQAVENLNDILTYIETSFGYNVSIDIFAKFESTIEILSRFPNIGRREYKDLRSFVLYKRTTLFYVFDDYKFTILKLYDNRQNPENAFINIF